jgi:hypothetical protein
MTKTKAKTKETNSTLLRSLSYAEITHDPKGAYKGCRLYMTIARVGNKEVEVWQPQKTIDEAIIRALENAAFYKAPLYLLRINGLPLNLALLEERILRPALAATTSKREQNKLRRQTRALCEAGILDYGKEVEHDF